MSQRVDFSMAFLKMQSLSLAELGLINNFWSARIRDIFSRHRGLGLFLSSWALPLELATSLRDLSTQPPLPFGKVRFGSKLNTQLNSSLISWYHD